MSRRECPGCGNTGLDSSHSWCQVCGGDSAIARQTIRHAFIAGAESSQIGVRYYRVGGYLYRSIDEAAEAYLQSVNDNDAQTSSALTRTNESGQKGVTLPVGEKPASLDEADPLPDECRHHVPVGDHCPDCEAMKE